MKKDQFFNKFHLQNLERQELERKWRIFQEEQHLQEALRTSRGSQNFVQPIGGVGKLGTVSGDLSFSVNAEIVKLIIFGVTVNGETTYTVDWGDGNTSEGTILNSNEVVHEYEEFGNYNATVSFGNKMTITQLDFHGDQEMGAKISTITGLQNLPNLQEFRADYNAFTSIDFSGMSNLTFIDISDCSTDSVPKTLTSVVLSGCTSLVQLRMDDSDFSGGLPDLSNLTTLEYLDIDECNLTGELDLTYLPNLLDIDASGNTGISSISISSSQPLVDLNLYDCNLSQENVDSVLVALSLNGVSSGYIDISGSNSAVGPVGASAAALLESNGWTVYKNS